jgi:hypothetical protein
VRFGNRSRPASDNNILPDIAIALEIEPNHRIPLDHKDHNPIPHERPHLHEHAVRDLSILVPQPLAHLEARAGPDVSSAPTSVAAISPASPSGGDGSSAPTAAGGAGVNANAVAVGVLVMGQVTYTLQTMANGNLLFGDGATVTANAPAATIDGQAVSFGASGLVIDASSTFPVSAQPPPTVGDQGQVLATPPADSSFQQFKGNQSDSSVGGPKGGNSGSAKAGSNGSGGSKAAGVDNGATGRDVFGASAFALFVGIFAALLV